MEFSGTAAGEEDTGRKLVVVALVSLRNKIVPDNFFFTIPPPQRLRNVDMKDVVVAVKEENNIFIPFGVGLLLSSVARRRCGCSAQVRTLTNALYHDILSPRRCPVVFACMTFGWMNTIKLKKPWRG